MFVHSKLVILIFVLTLERQVHTDTEAVPHSRPYMVILEGHMQDGKPKYCGGFLLNEDFVMTAAHCQARSYTVLLGVHNFLKGNETQHVPVKQAFPHKDYSDSTLVNDIMILKLSSKVNFSTKVKPIALADKSDDSLPKSCLVAGWGETENSALMSPVLREVSVTLIDNEQCPQDSYCSEGETAPGMGDGGSPLVCEGKAYGVVSSTFTPATGGPEIHVYTKIPDKKGFLYTTGELINESIAMRLSDQSLDLLVLQIIYRFYNSSRV